MVDAISVRLLQERSSIAKLIFHHLEYCRRLAQIIDAYCAALAVSARLELGVRGVAQLEIRHVIAVSQEERFLLDVIDRIKSAVVARRRIGNLLEHADPLIAASVGTARV